MIEAHFDRVMSRYTPEQQAELREHFQKQADARGHGTPEPVRRYVSPIENGGRRVIRKPILED